MSLNGLKQYLGVPILNFYDLEEGKYFYVFNLVRKETTHLCKVRFKGSTVVALEYYHHVSQGLWTGNVSDSMLNTYLLLQASEEDWLLASILGDFYCGLSCDS